MKLTRREQVSELLFVLAVAFLPAILFSLQTLIDGNRHVVYPNQNSSHEYGIFYECLSLGLLYYILRGREETFRDLGLVFSWQDVAAGVLLAVVVYLCTYGVQKLLILLLPPSLLPYLNPANTGFIPRSFSPLFFVYLLLNPFREELIVRGFLMRETFALSYNKVLAVIMSVLVQTSYHLYQGWLPALVLAVTFTICSVYYVRTSRLWPVVIAHLVLDMVAYGYYIYR